MEPGEDVDGFMQVRRPCHQQLQCCLSTASPVLAELVDVGVLAEVPYSGCRL